jgi:hypothetical protein
MGDFNSGTALSDKPTLTRGHHRIVSAFRDLGLVSRTMRFTPLSTGTTHPTYFHQFNSSQPWHIDFCFVPDGTL